MSKGKPYVRRDGEIRYTGSVPLPHGWASAVLSAGRIVSVEWEREEESVGKALAKKYPGSERMAREPGNPERFLREYSHGKVLSSREISALPIAWGTVPAFQRKVLKATAGIPYGRTATYGEIAAEVGSPGAARAVGAALSRNPWPILVPCHRVLGKGGRLVGFGKGIAAKEALLRFEEKNISRAVVA